MPGQQTPRHVLPLWILQDRLTMIPFGGLTSTPVADQSTLAALNVRLNRNLNQLPHLVPHQFQKVPFCQCFPQRFEPWSGQCLLLEGPPDWRRELVGSRSNVKASCGFNSHSFRCGRVRCWFPETDCESVWHRFDSARSPLFTTLQVCSWESSQPPKLTYGVRILTLVLAAIAA